MVEAKGMRRSSEGSGVRRGASAQGEAAGRNAHVRGELPSADGAVAVFAGVQFVALPKALGEAPDVPGLFILAKDIGGRAFPIYVGEGESVALAAEAVREILPAETAVADRFFFMERPNGRLRASALKELVGELNPPLNTVDRTGPAATALAGIVTDRAGPWPDRASTADDMQVTEADLERLVKEFYGAAGADPVLGPVFAAAIPDWDEHYRVVQNFWSRTLLGTQRYSGMPFAAHVSLNLKPEHFTRWVALFSATAQRVLPAVAAARAIAKVEHMSTCFQAGLFPPAGMDVGHPHAHPHAAGHPHRPHPVPVPRQGV